MKMLKRLLSFLYFFICASFLFSVTAAAYIDPSAMTYIIQIIAGVAIAAGAAFGFYFRKIKRFFARLFNKGSKTNDNWSYDENDNDDFGMGDYPVLECDLWDDKDESEVIPTEGISIDDLIEKFADKYDESGYDRLRANEEISRLLSLELAKNETLKKRLTDKI